MEFDERDLLLKAASIVEEGWTQGAMFRDKSDNTLSEHLTLSGETETIWSHVATVCASGAIAKAVHQLGVPGHIRINAINLLSFYISDAYGMSIIPWWNDDINRTKEEVAEAMRLAASA